MVLLPHILQDRDKKRSWTSISQRAANNSFTTGLSEFTVGAGTMVYTDTTVARGTKYFYRVKATNANGDSPYSNIASAKTQP